MRDSPRIRPSEETLAAQVGDEVVLVHTGTDQIYALNRTGARVWELLCDGCDQDEIARRLVQEFEVTPAEVTEQVAELLASLGARRLIAVDRDD
jgi:hypothetical protein